MKYPSIENPEGRELHRDKSFKHWEKRPESGWQKFQFNQPYAKGLERLKGSVLKDTNYDAATLWQWGTMQAMALIEVLKRAEATFGAEGQKMVFDSLHKIGYDIGRQVTEGTEIPEGMDESEWLSYYATVINRIAYASLEAPEMASGKEINFQIDWCPHQDMYTAFDCRVQRYFVQGMLDAAIEFAQSQGLNTSTWDVAFRSTIPNGAHTCFFTIRQGDEKDRRRWGRYTEVLEQKALRKAEKEMAAEEKNPYRDY